MSIEKKKIQLELMKIEANIIDSEIRIEERKEEIKRIEDQIVKYNERKDELVTKMGDLQ